jgi:arginyl-tRNA synthetase
MATTACLPGLEALLADLGLGPIPSFTAADVLNHPIDIYHSYLAANFQNLVECDPDLVYESILPANTTGNGDLDIVLPRLKLPGASPKELAEKLINQACYFLWSPLI